MRCKEAGRTSRACTYETKVCGKGEQDSGSGCGDDGKRGGWSGVGLAAQPGGGTLGGGTAPGDGGAARGGGTSATGGAGAHGPLGAGPQGAPSLAPSLAGGASMRSAGHTRQIGGGGGRELDARAPASPREWRRDAIFWRLECMQYENIPF